MTWTVEAAEDGTSKLTVTSALVPGSRADAEFRTGNAYVVSGVKTFLETGEPLAAA